MAVEFVMRRRVHFSETDRAGVLYFAHYYRLTEEPEHAFWRSLGVAVVMDVAGLETSWPRVATSCHRCVDSGAGLPEDRTWAMKP